MIVTSSAHPAAQQEPRPLRYVTGRAAIKRVSDSGAQKLPLFSERGAPPARSSTGHTASRYPDTERCTWEQVPGTHRRLERIQSGEVNGCLSTG